MSELEAAYFNVSLLSSTSSGAFLLARRRTNHAPVLLRCIRLGDTFEPSDRVCAILSYVSLMTSSSRVLGNISTVRETDTTLIIEYILSADMHVQPLSSYLTTLRASAKQKRGSSTNPTRSSSKFSNKPNNKSRNPHSSEHNILTFTSVSTPASELSDLTDSNVGQLTPRRDRRTGTSKSTRRPSSGVVPSLSMKSHASADSELIVWRILAQVLRGLLDFYEHPSSKHMNLVCSLSPDELLILADNSALLRSDFTVMVCNLSPQSVHTDSLYTAPELFHGHKRTSRADVWALGCLAFELVAHRKPRFNSAKLVQSPVVQNLDCSADMLSLVSSCLQIDPSKRPSLADLVSRQMIQTFLVYPAEKLRSKSEVLVVKKLDFTAINMRRTTRHKRYNSTQFDECVLSQCSESSDSISTIGSARQSACRWVFPASTATQKLGCLYYNSVQRGIILGTQKTRWIYDTIPDLSSEANNYISKRMALSFLLLTGVANLSIAETPYLISLLGSSEAIKQICDISFDGIALEPDRAFTSLEEDQLKGYMETVWTSMFETSELASRLLESDYLFTRIFDVLERCSSWVLDQGNPILSIKEELHVVNIVLRGIYNCSPDIFSKVFLVRYDNLKRLLSISFDTHFNAFLSLLFSEQQIPPFIFRETHQFFINTFVHLAEANNLDCPDESGTQARDACMLLLLNLSDTLMSVSQQYVKLVTEAYDLEAGLLGIRSFLTSNLSFHLLFKRTTTYLLTLLSVSLFKEIKDGTYSKTNPVNLLLSKLFDVISTEFSGFVTKIQDNFEGSACKQLSPLTYLLNLFFLTSKTFGVLTDIQARHLREIGIGDISVQSTQVCTDNYAIKAAYVGLNTPRAWKYAHAHFIASFMSLSITFFTFSQIINPYLHQIKAFPGFSSIATLQFQLCRLRHITLDLCVVIQSRAERNAQLERTFIEAGCVSRIQYYKELLESAKAKAGFHLMRFRQENLEISYLLANSKRLIYLYLEEEGYMDTFEINEQTVLRGEFLAYVAEYKHRISTHASSDVLKEVIDFIQLFT